MATLDDNSIDAIVCDPPYELGFMNKSWDNSGIAYDGSVWQQCLRVLKPGGHLIAFGGSRTYHRLAVAIEDAGFEIRDQIQWIYGSGFPKSHNLKDEWDGWGTALKPAHEPAVLARKPLCGTTADNVTTWGVGGLNIDGSRVSGAPWHRIDNGIGDPGMWGGKRQQHYAKSHTAGRWPANVIFDEDAAVALDGQSGERKSGGGNKGGRNETAFFGSGSNYNANYEASTGGASRFFYTAKASKSEREAGLYYDEWQDAQSTKWSGDGMPLRQDGSERKLPQRANHHPTVKPLSLMRYLVRLVTPKGGKVLDPFMGSGSTGCASVIERFHFVGIDITPEYVAIAQKRIDYYAAISPLEGI
jgi:site-specific DNA-methyltransferase (adenine-specific)